ncbi:MAG TPA: hypothetical protein VGQ35_15750 [Dongiaceae bacterium]|jgi:hypothetical protein|nr:hypothetical protein [Dongiaceae bacterium]
MRTRTDHLALSSAGRHHGPASHRSLRAEILILTARINFNP